MAKAISFSNNTRNIQTVDCTKTAKLEVTVTVWPSLLDTQHVFRNGNTYSTLGEPSLIRVDVPGSGKLTKLSLRTDRATEIHALIGAAAQSMAMIEDKTTEKSFKEMLTAFDAKKVDPAAIDDIAWDELFKANEANRVKVLEGDHTWIFPVDADGYLNPMIHLLSAARVRKGQSMIGVISSAAWGGADFLHVIANVKLPNGANMPTQATLARPRGQGFFVLNHKDELFVGDQLADLDHEDNDEQASYHRMLSCMASGESFIARTGSFFRRDSDQFSTWLPAKVRQLIDRACMTKAEIDADKLRILKNIWQKQSEAASVAIGKKTGAIVSTTIVTPEGEIVGRRLSGKHQIRINGKMVSFSDIADLSKYYGEYQLLRGVRGTHVRNVGLHQHTNVDTVATWGKDGYQLVSEANKGMEMDL